ncbi:MAG: DegT/DnrJ/EryC1/StrS family aminotransferase [Magnetococcus sp. YQC-9]
MAGVSGGTMIRLSKSCLSDAEKRAVMEVLDREYLGMGAEVQQFEQQLTAFIGRPAVCVVNGTAALHLALQAVGLGEGDEVLVQSLTYLASFQAISATNARPVACDIDPETLCLDVRDAEAKLTSRTKAVVPVHYAGGAGKLDAIYAFARTHGLRVVEDAAHAFGSIHHGKRIGARGDISCFSFDGIKNITSGEGGCVVTDDQEVLGKIRDARLLGIEKDTEKRFAGERSWEFDVTAQGWRYHMSNIMAAIGIEQLKRFPIMAGKRQELACHYDRTLAGSQWITPLKHDYTEVVPHIYVVRLPPTISRKQVQDQLMKAGIQTGVHYQPNHQLSYYARRGDCPCPNVERIFPSLLSLPLHPDMDTGDVEYICQELHRACEIKL